MSDTSNPANAILPTRFLPAWRKCSDSIAANLFFLANPRAQALLSPEVETPAESAWDDFRKNEQFRRVHNVTSSEMEMLSRVALLGDVRSPRDFIYILNTVRHAVGR